MVSSPRFCGECGARITADDARFCGECGTQISKPSAPEPLKSWRIDPEPPQAEAREETREQEPRPAEPTKTSLRSPFNMSEALTSSWQMGLAWLVGWLPIGYFFSDFYAQKVVLKPQWYEQYPLGWDASLAGMTIIYSSGALVGGLLAGACLYAILRREDFSLGISPLITTVGWLLLWIVSMWGLTISPGDTGDDTLIIAIPILTVIYSVLLSWLTVLATGRGSSHAVRGRFRSAAIAWGICGVAGFFVSMVVAGMLE